MATETENKKPEEETTPEPKVAKTEGLNSFASALDEAIANSQKAAAPLEEPEKKDSPKEEATPKEEVKAEETKPEPEKEVIDDGGKAEPDDQDGKEEKREKEEGGPELPGLDDDDSEEPEETPKQVKEAKETPEEEDDSSYDPPRLKKRIERAKEKASREAEERYKTELEKVKREKAELEAKLQQWQSEQPKADPLTDSEKEELLMLRRRLQAEKDPEIKKNFDDRIEDNRATVNEIIESFKSRLQKQEDKEKMNQLGDFMEFASHPANAQYAQIVINEIAKDNPIQARQIEMRIADNEMLKRGKQRQIEEMSKSAREWFEKQSQQESQQSEEYQKQVQERVQYIQGTLDKQLSHDSLQPLPTDGLEGDSLKRVQEQNSTRKKMREFIQGVRDQKIGNRVDDGINITMAAAKAIGYRDELKRKDAVIKALRSKLEDRKQAGSVTKGNRATAPTQRKESPKQDQPKNWTELIDNIGQRAAEMATGRE